MKNTGKASETAPFVIMAKEDTRQTLELLKQLQETLTRIDFLEAEIAETPARIEALEADTEQKREAVEQAREDLKQANLQNSRLENELKTKQETLSNKHQQTLEVKTNEQLWAIQKEIKFIEESISNIELEIIQTLEDIDAREAELKEAEKQFESYSSENKRKISELDKNLEEMNKEIVEVRDSNTKISEQIPDYYSKLLSRIQESKKDGIALAEVIDGQCQACHFRIRPQVLVEIKIGAGIHQCSNCSRILFVKEFVSENTAKQ